MRFLAIFLPAAGLLALVVAILYHQQSQNEQLALERDLRLHLDLTRDGINEHFHNIGTDLTFLSLAGDVAGVLDRHDRLATERLAREYQDFVAEKKAYASLTLVDLSGTPRVRVVYQKGRARIVPADDMAASIRVPFDEPRLLATPLGEVYVAPVGRRRPHRPQGDSVPPLIFRFAVPVSDASGAKQGFLVADFLGEHVAQYITFSTRAVGMGQSMLVNAAGGWIIGPQPAERGSLYTSTAGTNFARLLPQAWHQIQHCDWGQFRMPAGLFSFITIRPRQLAGVSTASSRTSGLSESPPEWKLISFVAADELRMHLGAFFDKVLSLYGAAVVVLALGTLVLVRILARLHRERDYSQRLIDGSPALICGLAADGTIRFVNAAVEKATGYRADELIGGNWWQIFHPGEEQHHAQTVYRALHEGREFESELVAKGGETLCVVWNGLVRRDENGQPVELVGFGDDVTERRRMESMRREFISMVSHELRTPLTSVRGALGLLDAGTAGTLPKNAHELVNIALKNTERLTRLANEILDLRKLERGMLHLDMEQTPLLPLVRDAVEANRAYAGQYQVQIEMQPKPEEVHAEIDPHRFDQVMNNLLSNAAKFSPEGGVVGVGLAGDSRWARVWVSDCGPGIAEADWPRVFEPFTQLDGSSMRARGGAGLGLHITRELVERMGGRLALESEPGFGSMFCIEFPRCVPESGA